MNKPKLSRTLKSCILEMLKSPLLDKNRFKKNDFEICDFSTGILLPVVTVIEDEIQHVHTKDDIRNLVISNVEKETGFKHNKNSDVIINAVFEYKNDQKEVKHIFGLIGENKKKNFSKNDVHRNENGILINMEKIIAFLNERKIADIEIKWEITRNPIYLTGNYIKTIRNISHSKGFVGDLKVATSIEEICSNDFVKFTESEKYSFSSLGREDVDVKMLGEGRPFLIELKNSKKDVSKFQKKILDNLCNKINKKWKNQVQISKFRLASQKDIDQVKKNICKSKIYSFTAKIKQNITKLDELENFVKKKIDLKQKTPIRVLHRRVLLKRKKWIKILSAKLLKSNLLLMELESDSGTYIKEFVHGDRGRTVPNLSKILRNQCFIEKLDVIGLNL